ncbi:bifunctional diaminohydroxyphosphoribosylaminopyrimidine deaminase/5-amino-6-(5-phosphoribosylamino)uracil reductase RibD [Chlamydia crocodili]|uniref:Riboflavin biosynthesis protein RibD n=1 Tax=Chlamydia crocodili TaxID=2766982 RepID=A0ABX8CJR6_9CHLA|nr:bifunctional diaminohydroxyphosphoribosylaminopyrimidine deaminase/5-amino-6-(5-phosphoribosylamino)uracil reductase RibD [Chlamydia crocodili]QVE49422.1 bifunctional diaminohydroxyphosphoribosylaminopyrimidine deaminase/5-amino-6-(5-phosphoribosylamino)uracil reductase RibD [Chlamydia crocodili]
MEDFSEQQLFFMHRAIELGEKGRFSAPPNPWVGCVIVKNGQIIGEGYHEKKGRPHAEENAINSTSVSVEDSDVYVTLEPCCHYGRTPPCVNLLIKHKISTVYVALLDPDNRVAGKGIFTLRQAGIRVCQGLGKEEAEESLKSYIYQRTFHKPWIVLKSAATLDGQTADSDGESQWITCPEARIDVGRLRASSQAIVVGSKTVLQDDPLLTARKPSGELYPHQPLRVVVDSLGTVTAQAKIFHSPGQSLYVTTTQCSKDHIKNIEKLDVEILVTEPRNSRVNLHELISYLSTKHILQVLIEGGSILHTAFLRERLANALIIYLGPKIFGDQRKPLFGDLGYRLDSAQKILPKFSKVLGNSLKTCWEIVG